MNQALRAQGPHVCIVLALVLSATPVLAQAMRLGPKLSHPHPFGCEPRRFGAEEPEAGICSVDAIAIDLLTPKLNLRWAGPTDTPSGVLEGIVRTTSLPFLLQVECVSGGANSALQYTGGGGLLPAVPVTWELRWRPLVRAGEQGASDCGPWTEWRTAPPGQLAWLIGGSGPGVVRFELRGTAHVGLMHLAGLYAATLRVNASLPTATSGGGE